MLSIIYFKKPILFVYFLLGLLVFAPFCCLGLKTIDELPAFFMPLMMFGIGYFVVFNSYVIYYLLTKNSKQISILNVDISSLRKPINFLFIVNLGVLFWVFLKLIWLSLDPSMRPGDLHYNAFWYSMIYAMVTMFSFGIMMRFIQAKIMASVIETTKDPKAILELCYADIRRILVDKLK